MLRNILKKYDIQHPSKKKGIFTFIDTFRDMKVCIIFKLLLAVYTQM